MNASEPPLPALSPAASPSTLSAHAPAQHLVAVPLKKHRRAYQLKLIPGIGIMVIVLAILLLVILALLIHKKNRELNSEDAPTETSSHASPHALVRKSQEGWLPVNFDFGGTCNKIHNKSNFF